jgi:PIN domain nuclease of toxin-antitoxin system
VRLLLDTHSFLWFSDGDPRLSTEARTLVEAGENDLLLSVASLWEIAIKASLGKLQLQQPFGALIPALLRELEIELLGITVEHVTAVAALPFHHRDPFDRLLIAQARVEQLSIVSGDAALDAYGVDRRW